MMSLSRNQEPTAKGKDSINLMKQWIVAKFSGLGEDDKSEDEPSGVMTDEGNQTSVPTIVISGGSEKSLNKLYATPPMVPKRPSPLTKTWSNSSEGRGTPPSSVSHSVNRSFWYSPQTRPKPTRAQSNSLPCTPLDFTDKNKKSRPVTSADGYMLKSPVFRFSQKHKLLLADTSSLSSSHTWSRSQLDSPSICGACGQRKFYGSRDLVGFDTDTLNSPEKVNPKSSNSVNPVLSAQLSLRRTSSCRVGNDKKNPREVGQGIIKAASHIDVQKQRTPLAKAKRMKGTGSKETSRSTISLTRSWSINLDTFRIVRNDSTKSDANDYSRKMSLNDNELRRISDRRRSSLLRLFCIDNDKRGVDSENGSLDLEVPQNSVDDIDYSPKVTRSDKFVSGDPVDDFRSTFETDSIRIPSIYGQVKIMFQFFNQKDELHLTLLKGSNLGRSQTGKLGIFAKVSLMPGKVQPKVSEDKHDTHDPVFYELFVFKMTLGELLDRQLRVKLYNKPGVFSISQPIGEFSMPLYPFDLTAVTVIWKNLRKCKGQKVTKFLHISRSKYSVLISNEMSFRKCSDCVL